MFQILSLDGGGIKGLFSAALLAALEDDLGAPIANRFDLIAGTSTGGIIALALGLGLSPREVVEFYVSHGPKIFHSHWGFGWLKALLVRKYGQRRLRAALQDTFKDQTLSASKKRLVIPSFSLDEDDVYIFRTAHSERLRRDHRVPVWKVALATSAAPTYFPVCRHVDGGRHIDGGVWANNPSMVAIVEATGTLGCRLEDIRLFSVGTSEAMPKRTSVLDWGGQLIWGKTGAAIGAVMRGQSAAALNQARFLLGKANVVRLSPIVPDGEFALDGVRRAEALIAKARHHSRSVAPEFQQVFGSHLAPPFQSLY